MKSFEIREHESNPKYIVAYPTSYRMQCNIRGQTDCNTAITATQWTGLNYDCLRLCDERLENTEQRRSEADRKGKQLSTARDSQNREMSMLKGQRILPELEFIMQEGKHRQDFISRGRVCMNSLLTGWLE